MLQHLNDETFKTPQGSGIARKRRKKAGYFQRQNMWLRRSYFCSVAVVIREFPHKQIQNCSVLHSTVIACMKN